MKFKKLVCSLLLGSMILGVVPTMEVRAEGIEFTETEDNNSYQNANEVTVNTGVTVIKGDVTDSDSVDYKKDTYDWYKITFEEQGKCDLKVLCSSFPDKSSSVLNNRFDIYNANFEKVSDFKYGLAHDAGDTFYISIEASALVGHSDNGYNYAYEITLIDDNSVEYVSGNHTSTSSAYMLTEGDVAFALGSKRTNSTYFAIEVPKGKIAEISIEPDADADMNEILKSPYRLSIIKQSTNSNLVDRLEIKKSETLNSVKDKKGNTILFTGGETYFVAIYGGVHPNNQWYSIKYSLSDDKVDKEKPIIQGVSNGKVYKKAVTIKYSDESGIKSAKLNGKKFSSGKKVTKKGSYTVTVTDKAGNKSTVRFKIK